ncbi:MAG: DVU0524 family FlgM-associated protein [Syntrophobacteraceae bacterium]
MVITDYRVQSVLRTYSKQLQRSKLDRKLSEEDVKVPQEKVTISEEARRRLIMDRVASQAFEQAYPKDE